MKNNDIEFIKDKFSQSGVNAPDSINAESIKERLNGVEPLRAVEGGKKNSRQMILVAGIALVTTVALSATIFFNFAPISKIKNTMFPNKYGVTAFSSYNEVKQELAQINSAKMMSNLNFADGFDYGAKGSAPEAAKDSAATGSASGSSGSDDYNSTYTQVEGVDEADIVKTDGKYIYAASNSSVSVFPAEPEKLEEIAKINEESRYIEEFYISGNDLITISSENVHENNYYYKIVSYLSVYDISDINNIYLKGSFCQEGNYISSRLIDNMLYLVSSSYANNDDYLPCYGKSQSTPDEPDLETIPAEDIYMVQDPTETTFTIISSVDIGDPSQPTATKAILGSADEIYCNTEHLYITAESYSINPIRSFIEDISYELDWNYYYTTSSYKTQVIKIDLNSDIDFVGSATVDGYIKDQYSLDEYEDNLRIATTSENDNGNYINNLYVLNAEMKQMGSVTGFANNESIKAVRYLNDTAYVITYEQTDPLFIIDLTDPTSPNITGEAKITGFSTMLVPVDENTLLGIGYNTEELEDNFLDMEYQDGLKLVVFDISDKANPIVSDTKVFKGVYSDVQSDPKALLYNQKRNDYTIPFYKDGIPQYDEDYADYFTQANHQSGIINFKVTDGKISITDIYSSPEFYGVYEMSNVDRCVYVDDNIYMIGCNRTGNMNFYHFSDTDNEEKNYEPDKTPRIDSVKYK